MIFECVINISEGQNPDTVNEIAQSGGSNVIDAHSDFDHNRSVLTIASNSLEEVENSVYKVIEKADENLKFSNHMGVHPRLGKVDVVPFVSYFDQEVIPTPETIDVANKVGLWANKHFDLPVFFYDFADEEKRTLSFIRKNAFLKTWPSLPCVNQENNIDALCVGARKPLLAINANLECDDLTLAKLIAKNIRESSGGYKGVKAIGLELQSQSCVQVSMNIVDTLSVNAEEICDVIKSFASDKNYFSTIEIVGLVPEHQFQKWSNHFLEQAQIDETFTIESKLKNLN